MSEDIKNYLVNIKNFEVLVNKAISLSIKIENKLANSWEEVIGADIFGRICSISFSLLKLIPGSELYKKIHTVEMIEIWDYSSVCILTRALFDSYFIYYHYCIDIPVDIHERNFKELFWNYYVEYKKIKMLEHLDSNHKDLIDLKEKADKKFEEIKINQFYQKLHDSLKKNIAKCEKFQIPNNSEIATKCGFDLGYYKSSNELLSRYVHSDSYCINQIAVHPARSQEAYSLMSTVFIDSIILLSFSIRDFIKIHPELTNELDDFIKDAIKNSENLAMERE